MVGLIIDDKAGIYIATLRDLWDQLSLRGTVSEPMREIDPADLADYANRWDSIWSAPSATLIQRSDLR